MKQNINSCSLNIVILSLLSFLIIWPITSFCQEKDTSSPAANADRISENIKFLPIPYINYNRSLGYQIGAVPVILFNPFKDALSPSSMAGVVGVYSENKTWFLMAFSKLYLDEDNWRIVMIGGKSSYNFQFFLDSPINNFIPYNTKLNFIFGQVQHRLINKLFAGISLIHMNLKTKVDSSKIESDTKLNGLVFHVSVDQKSSTRYPLKGFKADIKYFTHPEFLDNETTSSKIEIDFNNYFSMRKGNDILASRIYTGIGLGDLDFN